MSYKPFSGLLLLAFLVGCQSLQPRERPPEFTPAPADAPLWTAIDNVQSGDWQVLLDNGPEALDWRLRAIDSATDSIDLQTFLWSEDTTASMVIDHLFEAAERGVQVKILVDDSLMAGEDQLIATLADHDNIEYRVFNPFRRRAGGFLTRQLLNIADFRRLDHRMHNKAMIVDDQVAIVGGRNLADEYFGLAEQANFRDMELLVGGPIVQEITDVFDDYWNDQWSFPIRELTHIRADEADLDRARQIRDAHGHIHDELAPESLMQDWLALAGNAFTGKVTLLVDEPPEGNPADMENAPVQLGRQLQVFFAMAEESILLISAYLIPGEELELAIMEASARGVDIDMLTNSVQSNNHLAAHSAYRNHIRTLLEFDAVLYEVKPDATARSLYILPPVEDKSLALHAKVLVLDHNRVFIGSPNFDPRSMRLNTEMGLLVESEGLNRAVRESHLPDFLPENAWRLALNDDDNVVWISDEGTRNSQPAASMFQRIEDWFFAHLPIEGEL